MFGVPPQAKILLLHMILARFRLGNWTGFCMGNWAEFCMENWAKLCMENFYCHVVGEVLE